MPGKKIGYARVSTIEQNEGRQLKALETIPVERVFLDKVSGKNTDRPQLKAMLDYVREDDTIIITEYSRLARNARDLLNIISEIEQKGASIISLKENLNTQTPAGKMLVTMLAGIAEFERDLILERQREGIALAKAKGKYKGRATKKRPENWNTLKEDYFHRQKKAVDICKELNISRSLFYKWLHE